MNTVRAAPVFMLNTTDWGDFGHDLQRIEMAEEEDMLTKCLQAGLNDQSKRTSLC